MGSRNVTIGSRGSPLALWQANWIKDLLQAHHSDLDVDIKIIKTSGDKIQNIPLAKIGGKGLFVKEIEEGLLRREVDFAVHSMKDMPISFPLNLCIACVTKRENPFDALISQNNIKLNKINTRSFISKIIVVKIETRVFRRRIKCQWRPLTGGFEHLMPNYRRSPLPRYDLHQGH